MNQGMYSAPFKHQMQQGVVTNHNVQVGTNPSHPKDQFDTGQFSPHIGNFIQPNAQIPMPNPLPLLNQSMTAPAYNNFQMNMYPNAFPQGFYRPQGYPMMPPPMPYSNGYAPINPMFQAMQSDSGNPMNQYQHPVVDQNQAQRPLVQESPEKKEAEITNPDTSAAVTYDKQNEVSENSEEDDLTKKKQKQFRDAFMKLMKEDQGPPVQESLEKKPLKIIDQNTKEEVVCDESNIGLSVLVAEAPEEDDLTKKIKKQFHDAVKNRVKEDTSIKVTSDKPVETQVQLTASAAKAQSDDVFDNPPIESNIETSQTFDATNECLPATEGHFKYSLDLLNTIFEAVKSYKEPLPSDIEKLIKAKRLDLDSESFHQSQNQGKRGGMSSGPNFEKSSTLGKILGHQRTNAQDARQDNNKMRDDKFMDRFKYKDRLSSPPPPVLHKTENAWKPKRRNETKLVEDDQKYEAAEKKIRSILNKLTPTSFEALRQEFFDIDVDQDERYRQIAIDLIFKKAVEEPKFCAMYTKLCEQQVERGRRKPDTFYYTLLKKVQKSFGGESTDEDKIKELEADLAAETDEAKKGDLKDRLENLKQKEKNSILGNIKFISHLYTVGFVMDNVVSFCMCTLQKMFEETKDEVFVQYGIEMLEMISKIFFGEEKKLKRESEGNPQKNVDMFIKWISKDDVKNSMSNRIKVMIMNFEDFVRAGYVKQNADAGPKTIQQVHEDIQKEEDEARAKQLEFKLRQKQQRHKQQRHQTSGHNTFNRSNDGQSQVGAKNSSGGKGVSSKITILKNPEREG